MPTSPHSRGFRRAAALIAIAVLALVLAPAAASGAKWKVKGRGFGHGVGMSQYGAYGYALQGRAYGFILGHYFTGTSLGQAPGRVVRVLLTISSGDVSFRKATAACGRTLDPAETYRAHRNNGVRLMSSAGKPLADCGAKLRATGAGRVKISGVGPYRGALEVVPTRSGPTLNVINAVSVDRYVQGVIAGEMPSSWPLPALKAQAVAARSYALSTGVGGNGFDLYDDTRSQVYDGIKGETARTNRAARGTKGQVVMYGGRIAVTYYSASSGGETENVEYGFIGSDPAPYLKGVLDPYDTTSPLHRWRKTFTQGQIESRLGGYLKGRLKAIKVTMRGVSPRIVWARVVGSRGTSKIRGDQLQSALGGYSTWMRFKKVG
jgi:stage II sporulation protein D